MKILLNLPTYIQTDSRGMPDTFDRIIKNPKWYSVKLKNYRWEFEVAAKK